MCDTGVSLLVRAVWYLQWRYEKLIMYVNRILYDISGLCLTFISTIVSILFVYLFYWEVSSIKNNENTK